MIRRTFRLSIFLLATFFAGFLVPAFADQVDPGSKPAVASVPPPFALQFTDNRITLSAKEASARDILGAIEKQTGIRVTVFDGVEDRKVTLAVSAVPLHAMDSLLGQLGFEGHRVRVWVKSDGLGLPAA
jgi:hypothetical protein